MPSHKRDVHYSQWSGGNMRKIYSVSIEKGLEKYFAEIDYVLTVMERFYPLRRKRSGELAEVLLHYGSENKNADVIVPGLLFAKHPI